MVNDIFSTLRTYLSKVTDGDKKATEVATAVNQWLREGGEALKVKIEDEVERSVSKMGFVKRGEFEALKEELARLKVELKTEGTTKASPKKAETKASAAKKAAPKKTAVKKTAEKKASK
jgi:BMFP domain-containing protein YqiC